MAVMLVTCFVVRQAKVWPQAAYLVLDARERGHGLLMAMTVPAALPPTLAGTGELFQLAA